MVFFGSNLVSCFEPLRVGPQLAQAVEQRLPDEIFFSQLVVFERAYRPIDHRHQFGLLIHQAYDRAEQTVPIQLRQAGQCQQRAHPVALPRPQLQPADASIGSAAAIHSFSR